LNEQNASIPDIFPLRQLDLFSGKDSINNEECPLDEGSQLMESKEIDVGIFRIKLTFYRTGNVHMFFVNRITGEERILVTRNPLIFQKKVDQIAYIT